MAPEETLLGGCRTVDMPPALWSHGMVNGRSRLHTLAAAIALAVLALGGLPGYCPMAATAAAAADAEDAHDCCKTGISGGASACCHAVPASSPAAGVKAAFVALPVLTTWPGDRFARSADDASIVPAQPRIHSHSPPIVLRV